MNMAIEVTEMPDVPADIDVPSNPDEIEDIMTSIDWSRFKPTQGQCGAFAAAMCNIFPVDEFYGAWEPGTKRYAHVSVVVDGVILDATGQVTEEKMKDYAVSGIEPKYRDAADWGPFATTGKLYHGSLKTAIEIQNRIINEVKERDK